MNDNIKIVKHKPAPTRVTGNISLGWRIQAIKKLAGSAYAYRHSGCRAVWVCDADAMLWRPFNLTAMLTDFHARPYLSVWRRGAVQVPMEKCAWFPVRHLELTGGQHRSLDSCAGRGGVCGSALWGPDWPVSLKSLRAHTHRACPHPIPAAHRLR